MSPWEVQSIVQGQSQLVVLKDSTYLYVGLISPNLPPNFQGGGLDTLAFLPFSQLHCIH